MKWNPPKCRNVVRHGSQILVPILREKSMLYAVDCAFERLEMELETDLMTKLEMKTILLLDSLVNGSNCEQEADIS